MARILIGMSGGVDSAVAASILKRDAHDVVGVTFLFDDSDASRIGAESAVDICKKLGIEHQVVDASARYEQAMASCIASQVSLGAEPSHTAVFTMRVLLPALFELADAEKIRKVATGHYAKSCMESNGIGTYPWRLMRAHDKFNDQSFMLYGLSQDSLNRLVFPLSDMQEMKVRVDAMRQGLMVAQVPSGQSLYLYGIGAASLEEWLAARGVMSSAARLVDLACGQTMGTVSSIATCRLGQRFEFANPRAGMPLADAQLDSDAQEDAPVPLEPDTLERYVVAKDMEGGIVYLGNQTQACGESCVVRDVSWTSIHPIETKRSCRVQFEVGVNPRPCTLAPMPDGTLTMSFTLPVAGLASGKTVVFYSDDMVLGGGVIA